MAQTDHDSTYTNGLAEYGFEKSSFGARVWIRVIAYARQKKTKENKTRQEKTREDKRRQEKTIKRREDQRRQGIQKMARASRLFCCRAGS